MSLVETQQELIEAHKRMVAHLESRVADLERHLAGMIGLLERSDVILEKCKNELEQLLADRLQDIAERALLGSQLEAVKKERDEANRCFRLQCQQADEAVAERDRLAAELLKVRGDLARCRGQGL